MAKCEWCQQEMSDPAAVSCTDPVYEIDGKTYPRIAFGEENASQNKPESLFKIDYDYLAVEPDERCHDCKVIVGGLHHPGCDVERCPRCKWQAISCGCANEDEDEDEEDENEVLEAVER